MTMMVRRPLAPPTMARERPRFPAVASTAVSPGRSRPWAKASSRMNLATRSLMLPLGFRDSSLARTMAGGGRWEGRGGGVEPIRSRRLVCALIQRSFSCGLDIVHSTIMAALLLVGHLSDGDGGQELLGGLVYLTPHVPLDTEGCLDAVGGLLQAAEGRGGRWRAQPRPDLGRGGLGGVLGQDMAPLGSPLGGDKPRLSEDGQYLVQVGLGYALAMGNFTGLGHPFRLGQVHQHPYPVVHPHAYLHAPPLC